MKKTITESQLRHIIRESLTKIFEDTANVSTYYRCCDKNKPLFHDGQGIWITNDIDFANEYNVDKNSTAFKLLIDNNKLNIADEYRVQDILDINGVDCDLEDWIYQSLSSNDPLWKEFVDRGYNGYEITSHSSADCIYLFDSSPILSIEEI